MTEPAGPLQPPSARALLKEVRVVANLVQMLPSLLRARPAPGSGSDPGPVMVLPGFGTGDLSTLPLRSFLRRHGFAVEGWGMGFNRAGLDLPHALADISPGWALDPKAPYRRDGGVAYLSDRVGERVVERARALGRPLSLVGWSLGGTIAREVARDHPAAVERVVTLGSPVIGGPKYTAAAARLKARGIDLDWIEIQVRRRDARPIRCPVTTVFSRSDGVVGWGAAIDTVSPRARNVEIDAAHLGMGFNPAVWQIVLAALKASLEETRHQPAVPGSDEAQPVITG